MAAAAPPASFGGADDRDACAETSGSAAIAACTHAITSCNCERHRGGVMLVQERK